MGERYYYLNTRTGRKYEIVNIDTTVEPSTITLKGELSEFTEPWDKARFKELGYKRIVETTEGEEDA